MSDGPFWFMSFTYVGGLTIPERKYESVLLSGLHPLQWAVLSRPIRTVLFYSKIDETLFHELSHKDIHMERHRYLPVRSDQDGQ